ncbi:MAG: hypothetical protein M1830_009086 [Pleopsidium flavum]|nr:MAG: hypothetical protein M1830_009086 [Pleopsidium flavum]
MANRPTFIDLRSGPHEPSQSGQPSARGQLSPRIAYFDGEIPPAMSPLDAFAMQSRLLAKQLDDNQKGGRRVSRLPPLTIASSLASPRPGYFRSRSAEHRDETNSASAQSNNNEASGNKTELKEPLHRPISYYPRLSGLQIADDNGHDGISTEMPTSGVNDQKSFGRLPVEAGDYFGVAQAQSPDSLASNRKGIEEERWTAPMKPRSSFDSGLPITQPERGHSTESASSQGFNTNALAPPISPHVRHMGSMRFAPTDSSDDDQTSSRGASWTSQPRKLSSSSGMSSSHLPLSPLNGPRTQSPSIISEYSAGGCQLPRPSYNFSRPISRSSRPSLDMPSRQPSSDSQRYVFADDTVHTPVSINSEEYFSPTGHTPVAAPSYIYAKFSLPRGRMLQRDSLVSDAAETHRFEYEQPIPYSNVMPVTPTADATPLSPLPSPPQVIEIIEPRPSSPESASTDENRPRPPRPAPTLVLNHRTYHSSASANSATTIKAQSRRTPTASVELSAEDHLVKGIECHEQGSLNESTYHLRVAAKQNHPTAMLLYALACRHGWGMRPNQREGVEWLRKAADSASLEVADDEDLIKEGKPTDFHERKTRRAQFALSIYELGVSHMNGWGIEQDKVLALRCFEIAGNWGDVDALAEAGFCYAQGVGCKKDLKKAAKFYRMAEAKGMSTVGNSWIHKPKYADDSDERPSRSPKQESSEKKPRDKSKTRIIFGRKKSFATHP